jgi:L-ascorbate metabolism protein UlaG (beta-lactamase superfamily)
MNIQYYGHSCFKITTKPAGRGQEEATIFIDPFDKSIGLRPPQGQADLVISSHDQPDHNNVTALKGDPRIINIPGEYSVKGINITGINSIHDEKEDMANTIFVLESEDLKICHLGDSTVNLTEKQLEEIDGVDILMIKVAGKNYSGIKKTVELVKKIEPTIVIPMHYRIKGVNSDLADEKPFCHEIGNCPKTKISKLNLRKKDLENKNMEVVLMEIT